MATVGQVIRRLRTEKGWTQQELGDRLNMDRALIAERELDRTRVPKLNVGSSILLARYADFESGPGFCGQFVEETTNPAAVGWELMSCMALSAALLVGCGAEFRRVGLSHWRAPSIRWRCGHPRTVTCRGLESRTARDQDWL